jgi:hypothetical protein
MGDCSRSHSLLRWWLSVGIDDRALARIEHGFVTMSFGA